MKDLSSNKKLFQYWISSAIYDFYGHFVVGMLIVWQSAYVFKNVFVVNYQQFSLVALELIASACLLKFSIGTKKQTRKERLLILEKIRMCGYGIGHTVMIIYYIILGCPTNITNPSLFGHWVMFCWILGCFEYYSGVCADKQWIMFEAVFFNETTRAKYDCKSNIFNNISVLLGLLSSTFLALFTDINSVFTNHVIAMYALMLITSWYKSWSKIQFIKSCK